MAGVIAQSHESVACAHLENRSRRILRQKHPPDIQAESGENSFFHLESMVPSPYPVKEERREDGSYDSKLHASGQFFSCAAGAKPFTPTKIPNP
jgi:hypothetical protein